eukprot:jgi/Chlat1/6537/Chrsp45S06015
MAELTLRSPDFKHGGHIPRKLTADGPAQQHDLSPALVWDNIPEGTESLALIVDDPDAPDPQDPAPVPFVHWVICNIPPSCKGLKQGASSNSSETHLPEGAAEGRNDFKVYHYRGPSPPVGEHNYRFRLFALDVPQLDVGHKFDAPKVEDAMEGHILAQAELIGKYSKEHHHQLGVGSNVSRPDKFKETSLVH